MIDKGEKIHFKERIEIKKIHTVEFFSNIKSKLKGKSVLIVCMALLVIMGALFVQNSHMIDSMNKVLNQAEGTVHDIYDDSKVISAYKNGDGSRLNTEDAFVLDKMTEIIDQIIVDGMTDYEKEKAVYDWQHQWVTYGEDNLNPISAAADNYTPYGVLRSHNAICVGNATTFKLFMDALDIPCKIIHSTENGEHAWNIVQLNGEWYHVDVTFDGGTSETAEYTYFNVPDSIKDDGSWPWDHAEIPAANGTEYCYMLNNAKICDDLYQIPAVIKEAIDNGEGFVAVMLKDKTGFNRDVADFIANSMYAGDAELYFDNAYSLDGKTLYKFEINSLDEGDDGEISPEISDRLLQIINDLNWGSEEYYFEPEYDEYEDYEF